MRISISTQDLLLAGWHGIYTDSKQFWAHPELSPCLIRFHEAARIQRAVTRAWMEKSLTLHANGKRTLATDGDGNV